MAKYIKLFENHNGYTAYTADTENFILPNVSYCIQENEVHFNPYNEPSQDTIITAIFHSDSNRMLILGFSIDAETGDIYYGVYFKKIEVNGVDVDLDTLYVFDEWGDIDKDNFGYYDVEPNREYVIRYTLKDEYHNIEDYTFPDCQNITSINIPSGVTSIGERAFQSCSSLTSITIPSGVTSIGGVAFNGCSSLTSITIPNSVTSIDWVAFGNCRSLSNVTCLATTPPTLGNYAFSNNASGRKIYVPSDSVNAYKNAMGWSDYASDIEPIGGVPVN
ncbi:MAG: leucine-rich repeat domain-containing protein [Bacteroidaceae bacterium]|nr:leucine-rich repeat domain-containing protein [Bacteroidaceae bacterium]